MAKLPGLGPRSARRAVLHLIRKRALLLTPLADSLQIVAETAGMSESGQTLAPPTSAISVLPRNARRCELLRR
ncbi:UNVERIFIED_CONTAM: hypothetical protein GTU68_000312 [Idotea baltica]|nr:hypothetical protein [Idotea baltica]